MLCFAGGFQECTRSSDGKMRQMAGETRLIPWKDQCELRFDLGC